MLLSASLFRGPDFYFSSKAVKAAEKGYSVNVLRAEVMRPCDFLHYVPVKGDTLAFHENPFQAEGVIIHKPGYFLCVQCHAAGKYLLYSVAEVFPAAVQDLITVLCMNMISEKNFLLTGVTA